MKYTSKPSKSKIDETRDVHPLVAVWLTQNGYSYIHEYKMPEYGQVDFYAAHPDGHTLLVEVKGGGSVEGAIFQVLGYGLQIPEAKLSVAAPVVSEKSQALAEKYNVSLIVLGEEIPKYIEPATIKSRTKEFEGRLVAMRLGITNEFAKQEQSHETLTHVYNSAIFNMSTDFCVALMEQGLNLSESVEIAVRILRSYLSGFSQTLYSESAIGLWLLQDTSNGEFQHIVKFADDFGTNLTQKTKAQLNDFMQD